MVLAVFVAQCSPEEFFFSQVCTHMTDEGVTEMIF